MIFIGGRYYIHDEKENPNKQATNKLQQQLAKKKTNATACRFSRRPAQQRGTVVVVCLCLDALA